VRRDRSAAPGPAFRVAAHEIATTVADWLAELGVHSPLIDQLASAVREGDWVTAPPADRAGGALTSCT